jgi:hypothetical protein
VLGTPPALILSQDQTLKFNSLERAFDCLLFSYFVLLLSCVASCCHEALTLDGLVSVTSPLPVAEVETSAPEARKSEVCTLYLVFKEPRTAYLPPATRHPKTWILLRPFLGEPSKLTTTSLAQSTLFFANGEKFLGDLPGSATL